MLFGGKNPFYVAARLTPRFWVLTPFATDDLPVFATIRDCSPLFALFETIRTILTIRYPLFAIRDYSLFATIRYSGFPDTRNYSQLICASTFAVNPRR